MYRQPDLTNPFQQSPAASSYLASNSPRWEAHPEALQDSDGFARTSSTASVAGPFVPHACLGPTTGSSAIKSDSVDPLTSAAAGATDRKTTKSRAAHQRYRNRQKVMQHRCQPFAAATNYLCAHRACCAGPFRSIRSSAAARHKRASASAEQTSPSGTTYTATGDFGHRK